MELTSPEFGHGDAMMYRHGHYSENMSPSLSWRNVPDATVEFALMCENPERPGGISVHWLIYKIPKEMSGLPSGLEKSDVLPQFGSTRQGVNDFITIGYEGPAPPNGKQHFYIFRLFALREEIDLPPGAMREQFEDAIAGKIIEISDLTGTFFIP